MQPENKSESTAEQLQDLIIENQDVDQFLEDLAVYSSKILGRDVEVHCGVTLKRRNRATTVASSGHDARKLDEIQYRFEEGPCLHAIESGTTTVIADVRADNRWPDYFAAVADQGYYSMLGVPLVLGESGGAALNFYAKEPDTFTPETVRTAESYAAQASRALSLAVRIASHSDTADHLKAAMESRTSIDVAVGIIMAQNRCSQDEAIEVLTRASNSQNVKIRVLAERLVDSLTNETTETHFEA